MSSVNTVILIGRLGKDPELKYTQSGAAWCRLSLATGESWTDRDGQRHEKTEWHSVVVWKKQAEFVAKYCNKGSQLYVRGRLETRSWDDQNGVKRYQTDVVAEEVKSLDRRREESPPTEPRQRGKPVDVQGEFGNADAGDILF